MEFKKYENNIFSQNGEDGVIEEIFKRIEPTEMYFVEFGAWDGIHLSNCWNLCQNKGWSGLFIEGDKQKYPELIKNTAPLNGVKGINRYVSPEGKNSIENILKEEYGKYTIDLISIDIDGDDYYIFESFDQIRSKVVIIEYNPTIPPHYDIVQKKGEYFGASCLALVRLAKEKKYKLAHLTKTNLIFVSDEEFDKLGMEELKLEGSFIYENLTTVITSFDGTPYLNQKPPFKWKLDREQPPKKGWLSFLKKAKFTRKPNRSGIITDHHLIDVRIYEE